MPASLSLDLRQRIVEAHEAGEFKTDLAKRFAVSLASVKRFVALARKGTLAAKAHAGGPKPIISGARAELLAELVAEKPDRGDQELAAAFSARSDVAASKATVNRAVNRLGLTRKKSPCTPASRTPSASRICAGSSSP